MRENMSSQQVRCQTLTSHRGSLHSPEALRIIHSNTGGNTNYPYLISSSLVVYEYGEGGEPTFRVILSEGSIGWMYGQVWQQNLVHP